MITFLIELVWVVASIHFGLPFPLAVILGFALAIPLSISDPWCDGTIKRVIDQICSHTYANTTVWSWWAKVVARSISIVTIPFGDEDEVVLYAKSWLVPWALIEFSRVLSQEQAEEVIAQIFRRIDQGVTKQGSRVYVRKAVKGDQETHEL